MSSGCARTVLVDDPDPPSSARPVCQQLMAALPAQVLDQKRRKVRPGVFSAAWGDPAITWRCGVAKPAAQNAGSECVEVNGVGWFGEQTTGGYLFTTLGRRVFVEVGVPSHYRPEVNALVDVAAAVSAHDPLVEPCA